MSAELGGWAGWYNSRRGWGLIPIAVMINGRCSCGKYPCGDLKPGYPMGKNAGKHPIIREWTQSHNWVTSDSDREQWWPSDPDRAAKTTPFNFGLVTGVESGVFVLDIDPRNGGDDAFDTLTEQMPLPTTLTARTGGGGRHFYFKWPFTDQGNPAELRKGPLHTDFPGIDVQSTGAQVLLPPALHSSGQRYEWLTPPDHEIAEAPDWLVRMIMGDRGGAAGVGGAGFGKKIDVQETLKNKIREGQRNNEMSRHAMSFARTFGVESEGSMQAAFSALEALNDKVCEPPLELAELEAMFRTAIYRVKTDPSGKIDPTLQQWLDKRGGSGPEAVPASAGGDSGSSGSGLDVPETPAPGAAGTNPVGGGATPQGTADDPDDLPPTGWVDDDGTEYPGVVDSDLEDDSGGLPPDRDGLEEWPTDAREPRVRTDTDNGNARRLVDYYEEELRYSPSLGWFKWAGHTWLPDAEDLHVTGLARELPVRILTELPLTNAMQNPPDLIGWAQRSRDAGRIRKAVALANTDPRIFVGTQAWDADTQLLGVANGVVDLRTGALIPPSKDQYITKRAKVDYQPGAQDTRFKIFLDQVTGGNVELQLYLQRLAGYTLTGETKEQKFFLVYGPPGSGKSTLLEIISALLGNYALTLAAEQIMQQKYSSGADQYYIAEIYGKRMLAVSELPEAEKMKEDQVKRLTGGDTLMGRRVAQQPFSFTSQAKLWVATNHRPRVTDAGIWRRMRAIPFTHVPQIVDPTLKPYLQDPNGGLGAVLAWAVEGAVRWYASRDGIGRCAIVDEATAEYRESEDELGIFLGEETREGEGLTVMMSELYSVYGQWMQDRGIMKAPPIQKLQRQLSDRGLEIEKTGRRAIVHGRALLPRAVPVSTGESGGWTSLMNRGGYSG